MIAPNGSDNPAQKPLLLLHLEDSAADQRLAQITLRKAGIICNISCTDNLQDFIKLLQLQRFDLVLADYRLLGFTALDAWERARTLAQCPPFVLLSGAIGETAAVDAIRQGIADYLLKDDMARLPHVLLRALEVHEARLAKTKPCRSWSARSASWPS